MALSYDIPFYLRWTVDELKDMIALLKLADFDPTVINTDVADAIQDWFIRRFDVRMNSRDGDQGLSTSPPANLCLAGCHSFPVSCKATLFLQYLTSCGT